MGVRKVYWMGMALAALSLPLATQVIADVSVPVDVNVTPGTITESVTTLDFGDITLHPLGDTFLIDAVDDATTTCTPTGASVVAGSPTSGSVTVVSTFDFDVTFTIDVGDGDITFTGGTAGAAPILSNVQTYSTVITSAIAHEGGTPTTINIGGELEVPPDAEGDWGGSVDITINFS